MKPIKIAAHIETWAKELGFQQVGITDTDLSKYKSDFLKWLSLRFNGDMSYLGRNTDKRINPGLLLPGTVRIISARMNYLTTSASNNLADKNIGYISRYALGRDYHKTIRRRLVQLAKRIQIQAGGNYRAFTDSAPVLEKPIAEKAGIGWIGKNTLILNKDAGSWFFLGEIFTDLPLPTTTAEIQNGCGSCKACINICPTNAITGPQKLDARKCISYLTIENKGSIPEELRPLIGNRIFGCDDCQLICPWNRFASYAQVDDFETRHDLDRTDIRSLLAWDEVEFLRKTEGMAIRRINYSQWVRNVAVAAGNAETTTGIIEALQKRRSERASAKDLLATEHLDWALSNHT